MSTTAQKSTQLTNPDTLPEVKNYVYDVGGKIRIRYFDFTQSGAGDANSTVDLVAIEAGRVRILPALSRIKYSAFGASRTLDIGHTGYTKHDGTAVSAAADKIVDGLDVSSAGNAALGSGTNAVPEFAFETKDGTTIQAKVAGGTIPDAATLSGWIAYVTD